MNPDHLEAAVEAFIAAQPELARKYSRRTIKAHLARLAWRLHVMSLLQIDGDLTH